MNVGARDVATSIADTLDVPCNRIRKAADGLRPAGYLPSSQGRPVPLSREQIGLLILAALVGPHVARVLAYAAASSPTGETLLDVVAGAIAAPETLVRVQLDTDEPAATVTRTRPNDGERADFFGLPGPGARFVILDGMRLAQIVDTLNRLPLRRAGRPISRPEKRWN